MRYLQMIIWVVVGVLETVVLVLVNVKDVNVVEVILSVVTAGASLRAHKGAGERLTLESVEGKIIM